VRDEENGNGAWRSSASVATTDDNVQAALERVIDAIGKRKEDSGCCDLGLFTNRCTVLNLGTYVNSGVQANAVVRQEHRVIQVLLTGIVYDPTSPWIE
jgi:hypothetical protein